NVEDYDVIGFAMAYPHPNCVPYPPSVWQIGFLCVDRHFQNGPIVEKLIQTIVQLINPIVYVFFFLDETQGSTETANGNKKQKKHGAMSKKKGKENEIEEEAEEADDEEAEAEAEAEAEERNDTYAWNERQDKFSKKYGIGIYSPIYHKQSQKLYESLGDFSATDSANMHRMVSASGSVGGSASGDDRGGGESRDAFLYCLGHLSHMKLLLGLECFSFSKWPKSNSTETNNGPFQSQPQNITT
ncbi:hypothetical protein RFI_14575, partial [Reticulomyxa filosa]